jgi:CRISPR system Cascade subunit CasD
VTPHLPRQHRPGGTPPETGMLLSFHGPLQSWGERSHFNLRDTSSAPTRSGVLGLLASALGRRRDERVDDLAQLTLTVRIDRPGVLLRDLHTVGGGLPAKETVTTADGKKRTGDTATLLSHRDYLADAAFTLALTAPDTGTTNTVYACAAALRSPHWPPYLGRRSCPPEGPLLLATSDDALHDLVHLPVLAPRPRSITQSIEFTGDRPLAHLSATHDTSPHPTSRINDDRHPHRRTFRSRLMYRCALSVPDTQFAGDARSYLRRLNRYLSHRIEGSNP